MRTDFRICVAVCTLISLLNCVSVSAAEMPHPVKNPESPIMLSGSWLPENHHCIDFAKLPRIPVTHSVVSDVRFRHGVNQHNYLIHHNGLFWAMWSDGVELEDRIGQVVKYSTSKDGVKWNKPRFLTPYPKESGPEKAHYGKRRASGFRYISRGFWVRDGKLLALATLDEASGFFGKSLELHAFEWVPATGKYAKIDKGEWHDIGVVQDNAINNFPPKKMPSGEWAMSRRKFDYSRSGVEFLVGGLKSISDWESFPVVKEKSGALKAEEPLWWALPDNNLVALFRDNKGGHYLYRAFSKDNGRNWTKPVPTNFPDATSKVFGMRLSDGRYAFVSNPNPKTLRDPMTLALSDDGLVFTKMFYLVGGRWVDYPHMIEHEGYLYIAHSGAKRSVEVERVKLSDLDTLKMVDATLKPLETKRVVEGVPMTVSVASSWGTSDLAADKYGDSYFFMNPNGRGWVTFTPDLPAAGSYEVFGWWNSRGSRYTAVPYVIRHAEGETTVKVDQNKQGGQWVSLGTYTFEKKGASVKVVAEGFPGYIVADEVRFVKVK